VTTCVERWTPRTNAVAWTVARHIVRRHTEAACLGETTSTQHHQPVRTSCAVGTATKDRTRLLGSGFPRGTGIHPLGQHRKERRTPVVLGTRPVPAIAKAGEILPALTHSGVENNRWRAKAATPIFAIRALETCNPAVIPKNAIITVLQSYYEAKNAIDSDNTRPPPYARTDQPRFLPTAAFRLRGAVGRAVASLNGPTRCKRWLRDGRARVCIPRQSAAHQWHRLAQPLN